MNETRCDAVICASRRPAACIRSASPKRTHTVAASPDSVGGRLKTVRPDRLGVKPVGLAILFARGLSGKHCPVNVTSNVPHKSRLAQRPEPLSYPRPRSGVNSRRRTQQGRKFRSRPTTAGSRHQGVVKCHPRNS
jgi:hypothetical protein